ncbi:hypothetical protein L3X38_002525 [Prunus dulcis]|uniref:DNA topoisomerase I DNA binding eukaryotic-type domain-containing protein n=1 Tax=Prunus dulcis TaxID=3755 RepID=A0AAD4WY34_PRUDU|nr:hypothetical protein L3X38_002525 [Prunus dulcis]
MKPKPQKKTSSLVSGKRPLDEANVSEQSSVKRPKVSDSSTSAKNKQVSAKKEAKEEEDDDFITIADRAKKVRSDNKSFVAMTKKKKEKWATLVHNGVIFPPPYKPHGVKMLYNGEPVNLTPEQEEVGTMYAVMKDVLFLKSVSFFQIFKIEKYLYKNRTSKQ